MSDYNINVDDKRVVTDDNDDKTSSDVKSDDFATSYDDSVASRDELINEQRADRTLKGCFKLAERNRGGFVIKDQLLYHRATILGQTFLQLDVLKSRRDHVLKMAHDTFGGRMSVKRTKARISYTFFWPINQSINGGDGCRHQSASISVSYFLLSTHIQINLITAYILRSVSSSGKISCVIKNNILVNPVAKFE